MLVIILAGVITAIAAAIWLADGKHGTQPVPDKKSVPADTARLLEEAQTVEQLADVLDDLLAVMRHPQLGGPGFLTVQFPILSYGKLEISAQFPNIQEILYRRIVRGELEREELIAAGVPAALLERQMEFSTESGGMVLLAVETNSLPPELERMMAGYRERGEVLSILAQALGERYPDMAVRPVGSDLLLTPQQHLHSESP